MSSSAKLAARSGGVPVSAFKLATQKRGSEKGRSGSSSVSSICSLEYWRSLCYLTRTLLLMTFFCDVL